VPLAVKQHDNTELYSRWDEKHARVQGPRAPHITPFSSNAGPKTVYLYTLNCVPLSLKLDTFLRLSQEMQFFVSYSNFPSYITSTHLILMSSDHNRFHEPE